MNDPKTPSLTRRQALKLGAAALTLVPLLSRQSTAADAKASKQVMKYQDHPQGAQRCDNCLQFIPGKSPKAKGQCKVVEGDIDPQGWCIAWAAKPK
jgi:hypothetical protein